MFLLIAFGIVLEHALGEDSASTSHVRSWALSVPPDGTPGFTLLAAATTGVSFTNVLTDVRAAENQIRLNGSGVAAGDVDGDGWCDLYFCGLENRNALFRNLGGWRFEEVPEAGGAACAGQYSSGAVFADVDGDHDLDLLVGSIGGGAKLFANDGHGHFQVLTASGLLPRYCVTTMALADVDGDGDLDLYVANYRSTTVRSTGMELVRVGGRRVLKPEDRADYELTREGRLIEHGEPDALYLNEGQGRFTAVPWTAGAFCDATGQVLANAPRDWTLSAMFRDLNQDGAPDVYVCGDFHSPDHLWMSDGHGRFRAAPPLALRHTSTFSMSVDFADVNRDGHDDFFVADMLGMDHARRLMQAAGAEPNPSTIGRFEDRPQYDRSMLQVNRGDGTFAELACFAGLEANDWAWSAVFLDVDLDGYEDLLCNTGHAFDTQDLDADSRIAALGPMPREKVPGKLLYYPRLPMSRLAFRNRGDLTFEDVSARWGFGERGVSHGMSVADLDNDGDLDLVANHLNAPAALCRNDSPAPRVAVRLRGLAPNTQAIGARVTLRGPSLDQSQEVIAGGRYLSGAETLRVFAASGGGPFALEVRWRSGQVSHLEAVQPNRLCEVSEPVMAPTPVRIAREADKPWFMDVSTRLGHIHQELTFDDFAVQPLLPFRLSQGGPGVAWSDLNGDNWDDLVVGGTKGGRPAAYLNDGKGAFSAPPGELPHERLPADQTGVVCLTSADGTAMVLAGLASFEGLPPGTPSVAGYDLKRWTATRLVGGGASSPGPLSLADYDGDGDLDLFVGGRAAPGRYPEAADSQLFRQQDGRFELDGPNSTTLKGVGLVVGAVFSELDGDGDADLVLGCEWGSLRVFRNERGRFHDVTVPLGLDRYRGRWAGVNTGDFDGDGRLDIVAANWGLNSLVRATPERPYRLYYGDLDGSGSLDVLEAGSDPRTGREVPQRDFITLSAAMPFLRGRFPSFAAFGAASMAEVLGTAHSTAQRVEVNHLASTLFLNREDRFEARVLPPQAQWSAAAAVGVADFDGDGFEDVFLGQNYFAVQTADARQDAGRGLLLRGDGRGGFSAVPARESGILIYGDQRGAAAADFNQDGRMDLAVAQNGALTVLLLNQSARPGLRVRLRGPAGNPTGVGARLRLQFAQSVGPVREVHAGAGYWSQDSAVHVLATPSPPVALEARWPGGQVAEVPVLQGQREILVKWSPD